MYFSCRHYQADVVTHRLSVMS